jgi:hypothetical protein
MRGFDIIRAFWGGQDYSEERRRVFHVKALKDVGDQIYSCVLYSLSSSAIFKSQEGSLASNVGATYGRKPEVAEIVQG